MSIFAKAAEHYDSVYEDKDYAAEADYVHALLQRYRPGARSLLDLGCGTGRHAVAFAERGYDVVGVDRSHEMLGEAMARLDALAPPVRGRIALRQGDIRDLSFAERFDAVVSLFHVISYQITNDDVTAALTAARTVARPDGVFLFDCWYGPGVLTDPPASRVRRVVNGPRRVVRIAEPVMRPDRNVVDVNHQFFVGDETGAYAEFRETHPMRYFFIPELDLFLRQTGWTPLVFCEWMTDRLPVSDAWNLTVVAQNRAG